jgi:hypothetical protein
LQGSSTHALMVAFTRIQPVARRCHVEEPGARPAR